MQNGVKNPVDFAVECSEFRCVRSTWTRLAVDKFPISYGDFARISPALSTATKDSLRCTVLGPTPRVDAIFLTDHPFS